MATKKEEPIEVPHIQIGYLNIRLIGDSSLIVHKWSEKAKKQMLDKQMKVASHGKTVRSPEEDFKESIYYDNEGDFAFPAVAFKSAAVSACRFENITMTVARGAFHIEGEFVKIKGGEPVPREDMVRVGMGTADLRYRAEYKEWYAEVRVAFNRRSLSEAQIVNLFNLAGFGVGVGEWRPEKNGPYGRFHVATEGE